MGLRGPEKEYHVTMRLTLTHSQANFIKELSELHGVSNREVVRLMIDRAFVESMVAAVKESTRGSE